MNQRKVSNVRAGGVTFWAWVVSIAVHLTVLAGFGVVRFSRVEAQEKARPVPRAKISQIRKLAQAASVIPKPKVKKPPMITAGYWSAKMADKLLPVNGIFDTAGPPLQDSLSIGLSRVYGSVSECGTGFQPVKTRPGWPCHAELPGRIEFFGSSVFQRKVCFLVDCSGSMQGVFRKVQEKLKESIDALRPDQYFYVIFFGGDKLYELGGGRLLRATPKTKSAAYSLIDSIRPAGQTNAAAALERAVQIRDGRGVSPSVVYFLTDGFELTSENAQQFSQKVVNLLHRFAPATRINTIGFWPQGDDRSMLETIATQSGGEFVFVTGGG